MDVRELYTYQNDRERLWSLQLELARHESFNPYRGCEISDMPKGSGDGMSFAEWWTDEKMRLETKLRECIERMERDKRKIEAYIDASPEPEQSIIRYRVINGMGWDEIGDTMHMDRRTASRKFYEYVKRCP